MSKFTLINPAIVGTVNISSNAINDITAAREIWNNISQHINNNIPLFYFTLRGGGIVSHFSVKEGTKNSNNEIDYVIEKINPKLDNTSELNYIKKTTKIYNKMKNYQSGGARKRYKKEEINEKDDDDDDDYYSYIKLKQKKRPISYWWYTPSFYKQVCKTVFMPTFGHGMAPYVHCEFL